MRGAGQRLGTSAAKVPPVTRAAIAVLVAVSLLVTVVEAWFHVGGVAGRLDLVPQMVRGGELWRLVSYPWLALDPFSLVFGALSLFFFAGPLERAWGARAFAVRASGIILVPAIVAGALGPLGVVLDATPFAGPAPLILGLIAAFAGRFPERQILLFPFPVALGGDRLLWFEAGLLALGILFSGLESALGHTLSVLSLGLSALWFRGGGDAWAEAWWKRRRRSSLRVRSGGGGPGSPAPSRSAHLRLVREDDDKKSPSDRDDPPSGRTWH